MQPESLATDFATAERSSKEELHRQQQRVCSHLQTELLRNSPAITVILNVNRQIVWGNDTLLDILKAESQDDIVGVRPGELLRCIYSDVTNGCGTSKYCKECGALRAVLGCASSAKSVDECLLLMRMGGALSAMELETVAQKLDIEGEEFNLVYLVDKSQEKRRQMLERLFLHDIMNTVHGVNGLASLMDENNPQDVKECVPLMRSQLQLMEEELRAHRDLMAAESAELRVRPANIDANELLQDIIAFHRLHPLSRGRIIALAETCEELKLFSDPKLVKRILTNMIKNALEACEHGQVVSIGCRRETGRAVFWMHNPGSILPEHQLLLFRRYFTTKGEGRGLGAYSMKLIAEDSLHGTVDFESDPDAGTTFFLSLPLKWPND